MCLFKREGALKEKSHWLQTWFLLAREGILLIWGLLAILYISDLCFWCSACSEGYKGLVRLKITGYFDRPFYESESGVIAYLAIFKNARVSSNRLCWRLAIWSVSISHNSGACSNCSTLSLSLNIGEGWYVCGHLARRMTMKCLFSCQGSSIWDWVSESLIHHSSFRAIDPGLDVILDNSSDGYSCERPAVFWKYLSFINLSLSTLKQQCWNTRLYEFGAKLLSDQWEWIPHCGGIKYLGSDPSPLYWIPPLYSLPSVRERSSYWPLTFFLLGFISIGCGCFENIENV